MRLPVYNMAGEQVGEAELRADLFEVPLNEGVLHQAAMRQLANARLGTADTKTRADVSGGGRKPWRQKHTGRARQGSIRSPLWRHGGTVFGPHPRGYDQRMPKKMRRLALRSALSAKATAGQLRLLSELSMAEPRTKDVVTVLDKLSVDTNALILLPERDIQVEKSARNLPYVKTLRATCLNVLDLLDYDYLIMPLEALRIVEKTWGEQAEDQLSSGEGR